MTGFISLPNLGPCSHIKIFFRLCDEVSYLLGKQNDEETS